MKERIQKILSARGLCSRRQAEKWIKEGRVVCNGNISSIGDTADVETDEILVDGNPLPKPQKNIYILLNKPRGYVTTLSDEKGRKTAAQLVEGCNARVYPIGRLDMDSEGLLIFTNDGVFTNFFMHPRHNVRKTYHVWVNGYCADAFEKVKTPIILDGHQIAPPEVYLITESNAQAILEITIHEGRNRQIRRMCENAGMEVMRLKRISEGSLKLGDLPIGKWRYLSESEVENLRNHIEEGL